MDLGFILAKSTCLEPLYPAESSKYANTFKIDWFRQKIKSNWTQQWIASKTEKTQFRKLKSHGLSNYTNESFISVDFLRFKKNK